MTEDNTWDGDLLGRKDEAMYLERYFENVYRMDAKDKSSFVLNINSEWGHGKTWFLKRFSKQLSHNHPVVYFDAWKNDFSKDALLSFVSIICTALAEEFKNNSEITNRVQQVKSSFASLAKKSIPIIAAVAVKQATGFSIDYLNQEGSGFDENFKDDVSDTASSLTKIAATCAIKDFSQKKLGIAQFEQAITALINEIKSEKDVHLPIFIFVDELDRCRPNYAIELLESIKHLFSIPGIFFVVATDTKQLSHSIKAVYGQDFNSIAYLKRFFYTEYKLAEPNYEKMAEFLFKDFRFEEKLFLPKSLLKDYGFSVFFSKISEFFKLTARDQEQVFMV